MVLLSCLKFCGWQLGTCRLWAMGWWWWWCVRLPHFLLMLQCFWWLSPLQKTKCVKGMPSENSVVKSWSTFSWKESSVPPPYAKWSEICGSCLQQICLLSFPVMVDQLTDGAFSYLMKHSTSENQLNTITSHTWLQLLITDLSQPILQLIKEAGDEPRSMIRLSNCWT